MLWVPDGSMVKIGAQGMKCTVNNLEVMSSDPGWVELWVHKTSV